MSIPTFKEKLLKIASTKGVQTANSALWIALFTALCWSGIFHISKTIPSFQNDYLGLYLLLGIGLAAFAALIIVVENYKLARCTGFIIAIFAFILLPLFGALGQLVRSLISLTGEVLLGAVGLALMILVIFGIAGLLWFGVKQLF